MSVVIRTCAIFRTVQPADVPVVATSPSSRMLSGKGQTDLCCYRGRLPGAPRADPACIRPRLTTSQSIAWDTLSHAVGFDRPGHGLRTRVPLFDAISVLPEADNGTRPSAQRACLGSRGIISVEANGCCREIQPQSRTTVFPAYSRQLNPQPGMARRGRGGPAGTGCTDGVPLSDSPCLTARRSTIFAHRIPGPAPKSR